jgi:cysteine desulfurase
MSQIIYLDNAATTSLDPEVFQSMLPYFREHFGNPSSSYSVGRETRSAIELARKTISTILGVKPKTIYFTSGGTESNNTAIASAINDLSCSHIITSPIEHHAVLHTVKHYCDFHKISCSFVKLNNEGEVDYQDLEDQLSLHTQNGKKCLVSLMHGNNEIGSILDLKRTGDFCRQYQAIFHSDCVQTIGHYPINFADTGVHYASGAGHKFHGPKGSGILYINEEIKASPLILGGGQERNVRAGTENVYGIIGFAKALEIATNEFDHDYKTISELKEYMKLKLSSIFTEIAFNNPTNSLYTVLSVCFPDHQYKDLLVTMFDMKGICVSGGSACSSGDEAGSHVMKALGKSSSCSTIRFSFSKHTTKEEIDKTVEAAASIFKLQGDTVV